MTKRIICMLLAIVMLVGTIGVLSACKKDKVDDNNNGNNTACTSHVDANKDGKCDKCKADMPGGNGNGNGGGNGDGGGEEEVIDYPWEKTNLLFKMTHNSNMDELSSTCGRYLAGGEGNGYNGITDELDDLIVARNVEAGLTTKVNVTYDYYDTSEAYGWGDVVGHIGTVINSGSSKDIPDMYCNFLYDLVAASLNGYFANIMSDTLGDNYFAFNKDGYIPNGQPGPDPENDLGYMYEYMRSTTLSDTQMYIVASDYFTDMIRAFFIVPVNLNLLGQVNSGDLKNNIDDFYAEVKEGKWTYARLAEYADAISTQKGDKQTLDDIVGFALPTSGLPASGILYSTNITIVDRKWNSAENDYEYSYPNTSDDLEEMVAALSNLMKQNGVLAVGGTEDKVGGSKYTNYAQYGKSTLLAVRNRFCQNSVLFGGIECVGALEENVYSELNANPDGGFGIVPVPLYKAPEAGAENTYLTSIHNVGRPGAITRTTTKFAQCTAFLNYQSTHSEDILETYYTLRMQYGLSGSNTGTVEMLDYIRNNVRSSFDKTMEDAIEFKNPPGEGKEGRRWHAIIAAAGYEDVSIRTKYQGYIGEKQQQLKALQLSYQDCPQ